jgi:hypothetical protein
VDFLPRKADREGQAFLQASTSSVVRVLGDEDAQTAPLSCRTGSKIGATFRILDTVIVLIFQFRYLAHIRQNPTSRKVSNRRYGVVTSYRLVTDS